MDDPKGQNDDLTKKMSDLNTSINNLESQIAVTQKKLADSEGDRELLLKELKRLQAEKAELERRFNDLAVLRDQVRKLRDDVAVIRQCDVRQLCGRKTILRTGRKRCGLCELRNVA